MKTYEKFDRFMIKWDKISYKNRNLNKYIEDLIIILFEFCGIISIIIAAFVLCQ